jgi:hypothetical protein
MLARFDYVSESCSYVSHVRLGVAKREILMGSAPVFLLRFFDFVDRQFSCKVRDGGVGSRESFSRLCPNAYLRKLDVEDEAKW